jgi:hypothetical protein
MNRRIRRAPDLRVRPTYGWLAFVVSVSLFGGVSADQTTARDGVSSPVTGSGMIAGVLTNSDPTPAPIRRALLTLSGSALTVNHLTSTDDTGRFLFTGLPPGRFLLAAAKTGYVRDNYGSRRPGGAGSPIALAAGQRANLTMAMTRAGVITGTILLPSGAPTSSARVSLMTLGNQGGQPRLVPLAGGLHGTDDRGVYRISGLAPGEYYVSVSMFTPGLEELRMTDVSLAPSAPLRSVAFSTVFYPGVVEPARALAVVLQPGEERAGVDIPMQFVPAARIESTFQDSSGQRVQALEVTFAPAPQTPLVPRSVIVTEARANGGVSFVGVPPGRYLLKARAAPAGVAAAPAPGGRGGASPPLTLFATKEIEVDGHDQTDLVLTLLPGRTISGRIVFEPGTVPPPTGLTGFRINLGDPDAIVGRAIAGAFANDDGSFAVSGIPPGRYRLSVQFTTETRSLAGWTLKSAIVDGRDVLDEPLTIASDRDLTGMTVLYSGRVTEFSGILTDATGRPAPEFFVVAFSTEKKFWSDSPRRAARARPSTDGTFTITGLPPGDYYVCAMTNVDASQLGDPAFLEPLIGASTKITLVDGEKKRLDLGIR